MTRDLPFDDETDPGENADTAYRVATGVSRVARAGAYVTGGALVAANGTPGSSTDATHDSRNVGWTQPNDPQPDAPSPVVTFPELEPDAIPPILGGGPQISPVAEQFGSDAGLFPTEFGAPGMGLPHLAVNGDLSTVPGYAPGNPASGWDPSAGIEHPGGYDPSIGLGQPTYDPSAGIGNPGGYDPSTGTGQPGAYDPSAGIGQQPGVFDPSAGLAHPGGFDPSAGLGFDELHQDWGQQFGQAFKLPGADGIHLPGMNGMGLAQAQGTPGSPLDTHVFDGVGEGGFGVVVTTDTAFSVHVGLDGVWVDSHMNVEIGVGDVGDQLDRFNQSVKGALDNPANIQGGAADQSAPGGLSGLRANGGQGSANSPATVSTSAPAGPAAAAPAAPAAVAPAVAPMAAPVAPAPVAPAATPYAPAAPAPVAPAPVVPVPVAVAPVAPAAVAQPVVATPLQTTIQPDVATTPMANVWAAPAGQSPLTAPAVATPALFDKGTETVPTHQPSATVVAQPVPSTSAPGTHTTAPQISTPKLDTGAALTTAPGIPTKLPGVTDPATTKIPTADNTKIPGATDPVTTKVPTTPPVTTPDIDTPATTHDLPATTARPVPTVDDPDIDITPTIPDDVHTVPTPVPTVSKPAVPTATIPDNYSTPDVTIPTATQPTMDLDPVVPTMTQQMPVKPSLAPAKPIADTSDSGAHPALYGNDGSAFDSVYAYDGGYDGSTLSTHLMSETTFAETHHPVHGPLDITLL